MRAVAAVLCVFLALSSGADTETPAPQHLLRVLQLNLCNSGIAGCYTGRAVAEAAKVIQDTAPDVITLDEVCENDVPILASRLATVRNRTVTPAFRAAPDRRTGGATRCADGQAYGIGLIVAVAPVRDLDGGSYSLQDLTDPEIRVWLCADTRKFSVCATHLANMDATVALGQCRDLLQNTRRPLVVGGDFNLPEGSEPDVRRCIPPGYLHFGDGGVQYVVATSEFTGGSHNSIGMNGSTDHPALLVTLTSANDDFVGAQ